MHVTVSNLRRWLTPEHLFLVSSGLAFALGLWALADMDLYAHDGPVHANWLTQFIAALKSGAVYPRWLPNSFHELGAPVFYFYPPLAYYVAAGFSFVFGGLDALAVYRFTSLLAITVAVAGSRSLCNNYGLTRMDSWSIGLLSGLISYRALTLLIRNAFTEFFAASFLPLVLLGLELLMHRRSPRGMLLLTCALTAIILSSLPVAGLTLLLIPLFLTVRRASFQAWVSVARCGFGALLLSAFYWAPLLEYSSYAQLARVHDHLSETFLRFFPAYSVLTGQDLAINFYSIVVVCASVVIAWILVRHRRAPLASQPAFRFAIALLCFYLLSQLFAVQPLWQLFPLTAVGYPIRFNNLFLLMLPTAFAAAYALHRENLMRQLGAGVALATCALLITFLLQVRVNTFTPKLDSHADALEYTPAGIKGDRATIEAYLQSRVRRAADETDLTSRMGIVPLTRFTDEVRWRVIAHDTKRVALAQFYWPAWQASVNGAPIRTYPNELGLTMVDLPFDTTEVIMTLKTSFIEQASGYTSIASLFLFTCIVLARAGRVRWRIWPTKGNASEDFPRSPQLGSSSEV
jgi:hypothetical protein